MIKPSDFANGVNGSKTPINVMLIHIRKSHLLGLLRKNGVRAVLMTKTMRISVAIDSINHPVWNNEFFAWKINSITPKVT